jgi:hypothetical protein
MTGIRTTGIWIPGLQMTPHFELHFPCFIVRREDESRFAVVSLPSGERAIAVLTDPNLVQMFVIERCFDRVAHRPLPVNTPAGLARILKSHVPPEVTHVVFNPNGVQPFTETLDRVLHSLEAVAADHADK